MVPRWMRRRRGRKRVGPDAHVLLDRVRVLQGARGRWTVADGADVLRAELARARRYERPFSIVVLSTAPLVGDKPKHENDAEGRSSTVETHLPQIVSLITAQALCEMLRESDVVHYQSAGDRFVLGLLEAGGEESWEAIRRIRASFRAQLGLEVHAGAASFPEDGLTLEELVNVATDRRTRVPAGPSPDQAPPEAARPVLKLRTHTAGGD